MNHLYRELAPITSAAWGGIDAESSRTLRSSLAARRVVEFEGPGGWEQACVSTGRVAPLDFGGTSSPDVTALTRTSRPMIELRADFSVSREELDTIDRGSSSPDLDPVRTASRAIAAAEDSLVFYGNADARIDGIVPASPHEVLDIGGDYSNRFVAAVGQAVAVLRAAGVDGPYAVALGARYYAGVIEGTEHGGYPVLRHLGFITEGPVVYAPALDGVVVLSLRGGDFRLHVGQDLSIGYASHDEASVRLYVQESLTFSNDSPEAAVSLV